MGVFLGQLPPAEIARLKAELAETLIANFCYPRFLDYRTNALRMRPVDRSKRQEVWLYLSSVDFTSWHRIDLMSIEFQYQIERLFIQFVQRNRSFFGEQGRKRMGDVRMLIGSAATAVAEGLRGHLTGQRATNPAFGSPRPVVSWAAIGVTGKPDPTWEQVASSTMLLQQQLQEARGEIKAAPPPPAEQRPAAQAPSAPVARRPIAGRVGAGMPEQEAAVASSRGSTQRSGQSGTLPPPQTQAPAAKAAGWSSAPAAPARRSESYTSPADAPTAAQPALGRNSVAPAPPARPAEKLPTISSSMPAAVQPRGLPFPNPSQAVGLAGAQLDNAPVSVGSSDEDVAVFEQMRQQLIVWLRVETVRAGLEIASQGPAQLFEQLRQENNLDETRLQVVSTLLDLTHQVIKNRNASMLDYKQGLMLYLMHTRRAR